MSQAPHEAINVPNTRFVTGNSRPHDTHLRLLTYPAAQIGDYQYPLGSAPDQPSHGVSNFVDGSGPIFSMYLEMASEEDKKNAENWKADADGVLIFVRLYLPILCFLIHADSLIIDRFILCCCRVVDLVVDSGHSTEPTGHIQLLPCQYLWSYFRPKSVQYFNFPPIFPTHILPTHLCRLGECPLVLKPGHQSYLCSTRNVATAVGPKISQGYSAALQPTQASTDPCVLCWRRRQVFPSLGS